MTALAPTKPEHVWQCNGCPERTENMDEAREHALSSGHMLFEVGETTVVGKWTGWASAAGRSMYSLGERVLVRGR
jgi:hypothetical protein